MSRRRSPEEDPRVLAARASFLRAVASAIRAGRTIADALEDAGRRERTIATRMAVAARLSLGARAALAASDPLLGRDAQILRLAVTTHVRIGGDGAALLDALAEEIEDRADVLRAARAHAAGAVASARTIALLPAGALLVLPLLGSGLSAVDAVPAGLGALLGAGGFLWLDRLLPRPAAPKITDLIPVLLCGAVAAGIPWCSALRIVIDEAEDPRLVTAAAAVRMGAGWSDALLRSGCEPLASLGKAIFAAARDGSPLGPVLLRHVHERRLAGRRRYEEAVRRAPVRMILPLGLCVLPAFALVTLGPFLRSVLVAS